MNLFSNLTKGLTDGITNITKKKYTFGNRIIAEVELLAEGGFAYVFRARDVESGEEFALKKVLCQDSAAVEAAHHEVSIFQ